MTTLQNVVGFASVQAKVKKEKYAKGTVLQSENGEYTLVVNNDGKLAVGSDPTAEATAVFKDYRPLKWGEVTIATGEESANVSVIQPSSEVAGEVEVQSEEPAVTKSTTELATEAASGSLNGKQFKNAAGTIIKVANGEVKLQNGNALPFTPDILTSQWEEYIEPTPEYVTIEKALEEMREGKTIQICDGNGRVLKEVTKSTSFQSIFNTNIEWYNFGDMLNENKAKFLIKQ